MDDIVPHHDLRFESGIPNEAAYDRAAEALRRHLPPSRVITDALRLFTWGTDASPYRLVPKIVAVVESEAEVRFLLSLCRDLQAPLTFRAAGTSLSGQAISDSILAVLGENWNRAAIEQGGAQIRLGPGMIGAEANRRLLPYARKIGPDPASIDSCKIGGIVNNNSSGMCCGVTHNTYRTMKSLRFMLSDGTLVDSGDPVSRAALRASHGSLLDALEAMGRNVRKDRALASRIRHKFRIKCTTGYSLNALVDYADPIDILAHLIVGSEGTLAFVSEVVLETVPEHPHKASALLCFPDILAAGKAVMTLEQLPVAAVELFDRASLRSVAGKPGMPEAVEGLGPDAAALLVETRAENEETLHANIALLTRALAAESVLFPPAFTADPAEAAKLWNIRKGLIPAAGGARATGTSVILEDVAFPMERLAPAIRDLRQLLDENGYSDAVIFGHALAGNLHFLLAQDFDQPSEIERYHRFMDGLAELVVGGYDGSLKAEHGTGRNVAPYVELEWGAEAMDLMRQIKALIDPTGLLNPGVLLSDDPHVHVKNLKRLPIAFDAVDKCIECGFCERMCPSKGLTLSPRQRIVGYREITRRETAGEDSRPLRALFDYQGIDTCAADGLCATVCPVGIDTGVLTKALRGERRGFIADAVGTFGGSHFAGVAGAARGALSAGELARRVIGAESVEAASRALRAALGSWLPTGLASLPNKASPVPPPIAGAGHEIVYVPCCTSRIMGPPDGSPDRRSLPEVVHSLLAKAGFGPVHPAGLESLCCGLPFESKGLARTAESKLAEMAAAVVEAGDHGRLEIVIDASPCAARLKDALAGRAIVHDLPEFLNDQIVAKLEIDPTDEPVLLHLPCSVKRMGGEAKLARLAQACSSRVTVPHGVNCCGFAGDKGFFRPELNEYALRHLCDEAEVGGIGASSSRSCEIGLARYGARPFSSIAYLLDHRSRSKT
jgi:D-lactate dehydrogenase